MGGRGIRSAEETNRIEEHILSDYMQIKDKGCNRFLTGLIKERPKQK